jgi:hypothetical protein
MNFDELETNRMLTWPHLRNKKQGPKKTKFLEDGIT